LFNRSEVAKPTKSIAGCTVAGSVFTREIYQCFSPLRDLMAQSPCLLIPMLLLSRIPLPFIPLTDFLSVNFVPFRG